MEILTNSFILHLSECDLLPIRFSHVVHDLQNAQYTRSFKNIVICHVHVNSKSSVYSSACKNTALFVWSVPVYPLGLYPQINEQGIQHNFIKIVASFKDNLQQLAQSPSGRSNSCCAVKSIPKIERNANMAAIDLATGSCTISIKSSSPASALIFSLSMKDKCFDGADDGVDEGGDDSVNDGLNDGC